MPTFYSQNFLCFCTSSASSASSAVPVFFLIYCDMAESEFGYISTGGGTAGCVLANRLSADPSVKVWLLEAGGSDRHPSFHLPAGFAKMTKGIGSWGWSTVAQRHLKNRVLRYTQAKVIGGGSSINAQIYTRGVPADYDAWVRDAGAHGWSYREVLPYFKRAENNERYANEYHGYGGAPGGVDTSNPPPRCRSARPSSRPGRSWASPSTRTSTARIRRGWATTNSRNRMRAVRPHRRPTCIRSAIGAI